MKLWKHMKEVHGMKLVIELVVELVMVLVLHRYGARRRRRLPMSSPLAGAGMAEILLFTPIIRVSRASLAIPGARELFEWTEDERERERQSPIYIYWNVMFPFLGIRAIRQLAFAVTRIFGPSCFLSCYTARHRRR